MAPVNPGGSDVGIRSAEEGAGPSAEAARLAAEGDLREFLRQAEALGDVLRVEGADPHLEVGALYELSNQREQPPVLLFERMVGCDPAHRLIANVRVSRVFSDGKGLEAVRAARRRRRQRVAPLPPEVVPTGPVCEHVEAGAEVDVLRFPAPRWHGADGGRYIGTECLVINRDPDSDWVNVGTQRVELHEHDPRVVTVFIEPGKHADVIRRRWWRRGEPCPMVVSFGQAPLLGVLAGTPSQPGESELAVAGGRLGRPLAVVRGERTGLPIPADAELVFEGFMPPPDVEALPEGPFGEWTGYYASATRPEPVLRVETVYHRHDLMVVGAPPIKPTYPGRLGQGIGGAAAVWDALEAAGVPGIEGVWRLQGGGSRFITVVAIRQQHPGHAQMAGLVATGCGAAAYLGRMTIVVDHDIDITDPVQVLWALATRWDPKTQTDVIDNCWTGHIDPLVSPEKRRIGDLTNSRAILYAVRPYHWREQFPAVNELTPELAAAVRAKWAPLLPFLRDQG